tara:strand:+ start:158 stop:679 length:522 start_codon:yes stop_codon:yes gene_type:complete
MCLALMGLTVPSSHIVPTPQTEVRTPAKDREAFLDDIGHSESRNDYSKVNKYGYLGRYQFSRATLKLLGIHVTKKEFLENHQLQEDAMFLLLIANKKNLRKEIKKYKDVKIKGIVVTESGILASAHLVGSGKVKRWLKTNGKKTKKDALGTSIESYMKKFGGYTLNLPGTVKI